MLINLLFLVKKRDGSRENSKLTILLEKKRQWLAEVEIWRIKHATHPIT